MSKEIKCLRVMTTATLPADSTVPCRHVSFHSPCVILSFVSAVVSVLQVPVWCSLRQQWGVDLYVFDDRE